MADVPPLTIPPAPGGNGGLISTTKLNQLLSRVALLAIGSITRRAFPDGGTSGHSIEGTPFPALSQGWRWYKSGTYPYKSAKTRAWATARRAKSGLPGPGPLVNELGTRRRLAPRSQAPDMRVTNLTAQALSVVRQGAAFIVIGFRDARSRRLFPYLERRNQFWGLSTGEVNEVTRLVDAELPGLVTLTSQRLTIRFEIGKT